MERTRIHEIMAKHACGAVKKSCVSASSGSSTSIRTAIAYACSGVWWRRILGSSPSQMPFDRTPELHPVWLYSSGSKPRADRVSSPASSTRPPPCLSKSSRKASPSVRTMTPVRTRSSLRCVGDSMLAHEVKGARVGHSRNRKPGKVQVVAGRKHQDTVRLPRIPCCGCRRFQKKAARGFSPRAA